MKSKKALNDFLEKGTLFPVFYVCPLLLLNRINKEKANDCSFICMRVLLEHLGVNLKREIVLTIKRELCWKNIL